MSKLSTASSPLAEVTRQRCRKRRAPSWMVDSGASAWGRPSTRCRMAYESRKWREGGRSSIASSTCENCASPSWSLRRRGAAARGGGGVRAVRGVQQCSGSCCWAPWQRLRQSAAPPPAGGAAPTSSPARWRRPTAPPRAGGRGCRPTGCSVSAPARAPGRAAQHGWCRWAPRAGAGLAWLGRAAAAPGSLCHRRAMPGAHAATQHFSASAGLSAPLESTITLHCTREGSGTRFETPQLLRDLARLRRIQLLLGTTRGAICA
jgi:hypothetical protein